MATTYATVRMPRHHASAIQMSVPTGWRANRFWIVSTIDVPAPDDSNPYGASSFTSQ